MKKILALLLTALLLISFTACKNDNVEGENTDTSNILAGATDKIYGEFTYDINERGDYDITGITYVGVEPKDITLPSEIEGRPVTGIAADAFKANKTIRNVTIPSSVTSIGNYAFFQCESITSIVLPDSVTTIGNGAFKDCYALESVTFSKSLTRIGNAAFMNCTKLTNPVLAEGLLSIGMSAFENCDTITAVTIPSTVVEFGAAAFYKCSNLAEVTFMGTANDSDKDILAKMNTAIAEHMKTNAAPEDFDAAMNILASAGYHLGNYNDTGAAYVWDATTNQVYGYVTASDSEMLTKMNAALANAQAAGNVPTSLNNAILIINDAEPELEIFKLNTSTLVGNKFTWNEDTNSIVILNIGKIIFNDCAENLKLNVIADSEMAKYAVENEYNIG